MKTTILLSLALFMLAANAPAADSGNISMFPMVQPSSAAPETSGSAASHANTLSSSDRAKVANFVNANLPPHWMEVPLYSVAESYRAGAGGGNSEFFVLLDVSGRGYSNTLLVYSQDSAGKAEVQEIDGWKMANLKQMVRDLNGDGKDELIIPEEIGPGAVWYPLMAMPTWPTVYRLENGKYVEASRDFPNYYDREVLPQLSEEGREAKARMSREPFQQETVAVAEMTKAKILRVLGRDPVAGLNQAYQWMNSDNPQLMQCAIATFSDIGGHERQVSELRQVLPAAVAHAIQAHKGG